MTLKTRNTIVTGSTSGIGLAIARALAKEGANIMINGMGDAVAIEAERATIEKEFGVTAIYSGADMTKPDERIDMTDEPGHDDLCEREQRFLINAIDKNVDLGDHMDDAIKSLRIVMAADQSFLASAGNDGTIRIWRAFVEKK